MSIIRGSGGGGDVRIINPYPANVDNMASSYQCRQMADGI